MKVMTTLLAFLLFGSASAFFGSPSMARMRRSATLPAMPVTKQFDPSKFLRGLFDGGPTNTQQPSEVQLKDALLAAVQEAKSSDREETAEAVLVAFKEIEGKFPAPNNLLDVAALASTLEGEWVLEYTVAEYGAPGSGGGDGSKRGKAGAVNATGINVDTTGEGVRTTQTFDVEGSRVANDIVIPGPLGLEARLRVAGPFTRRSVSKSTAVPPAISPAVSPAAEY